MVEIFDCSENLCRDALDNNSSLGVNRSFASTIRASADGQEDITKCESNPISSFYDQNIMGNTLASNLTLPVEHYTDERFVGNTNEYYPNCAIDGERGNDSDNQDHFNEEEISRKNQSILQQQDKQYNQAQLMGKCIIVYQTEIINLQIELGLSKKRDMLVI